MKRIPFPGFVAFVLVAALLTVLSPATSVAQSPTTTPFAVHFVDVAQGDAAWLKTPDGVDIIIDGGRKGQGSHLLSYLQDHGVADIEVMVATHPDADHVGGLITLVNRLPVHQVLLNGQSATTQTYQDLINAIAAKAVPTVVPRAGDTFVWGCCVTARTVHPVEPPGEDTNNASIVLRISYGQTDFLFTGDIEEAAEKAILERGELVEAEVLKVAHHGSKSGSSTAFLNAVSPEVAVISVGPNPYGHPSGEVLARLSSVGASIYRTDLQGTIVVETNGEVYSVRSAQVVVYTVFLPLVIKEVQPPTPTPTPTLTPVPTADVVVGHIQYSGRDEYVRIDNRGTVSQDMTGWFIQSYALGTPCYPASNQRFYFPSGYVLPAGASVWVHSGPDSFDNPPTDLRWTSSYIWNNDGDVGVLYNAVGQEVDRYAYGGCR